jgi:hypothetical protein
VAREPGQDPCGEFGGVAVPRVCEEALMRL